jgi:HD-GYP domain-containing protein (c-di-GMP phosphodiesterase class II)
MSNVVRLPLSEVLDLLVVGQPLPFHVLDPQERRLLAQGNVVVSQTQLEMLIERGAWVDANEAAVLRQSRQPAPSAQRALSLFDHWEKMVWELDAALRLVLAGQPAMSALDALVLRLDALVRRDLNVALYVTIQQHEVRVALYALQHALHSATVLMELSPYMGWDASQLRSLLLAALTMNVSTLELQAAMAQQVDPPSARQRAQIRAHPDESVRLLRQAGVTDEAWLMAVRDHHERADGTGYPRELKAVGAMAHALRVADVFTAKISARAIRQALPIQAAAKQLFQEEQGGPLATSLIKALGLYPPGELVQLKNGEKAVVTHRGPTATTPLVASFTDTSGRPVVSTVPRDSALPEFAITGVVTDRKGLPRLPPERVYGVIDFS